MYKEHGIHNLPYFEFVELTLFTCRSLLCFTFEAFERSFKGFEHSFKGFECKFGGFEYSFQRSAETREAH